MLSAVIPASPRNSESAIEKHAACAAATSSSGFVPFSFSNRILKLYGTPARAPLSVDTEPFPSLSPPLQTALALRFIPNDTPLEPRQHRLAAGSLTCFRAYAPIAAAPGGVAAGRGP